MQLTKMVIVKHWQDNGKYLFRVPLSEMLNAGDQVLCDTARGKDQPGTCCCDSFMADAEVVCKLFGTQPHALKYVTGEVEFRRFDMDEEEQDES